MLDEHAAQVRAWLEAQPGLSAQAVLARLIEAARKRCGGDTWRRGVLL
jgi:hypothetical protein